MLKEQTMWIDYLSNSQAVRGVFGENIPELRRLELEQIILDPSGGVDVALNLGSLPDKIPARWMEKGFDSLQFRMRFTVRELAIRRNGARVTQKVSVELEDGRLHVVSEDGLFELTASVISARIEFFPYRRDEYEFPPTWYRQ
jgi:hypothetical protein